MSDLPQLLERRQRRTFAGWDEYVSTERIAGAEALVHQLIDRLVALGSEPDEQQVREEIDECVRGFNALDQGWIATIEREDICDVLWELIELCGHEASEEWMSERDW